MGKFFVGALVLCACASGQAATITSNANFESGDFTGWQTIGVTNIGASGFPGGGISDAILMNFGGLARAQVNAFAGMPESALGGVNGSAIKTQVTVEAGSVLKFDWTLSSEEFNSGGLPVINDFAFFYADGVASKFAITFNINQIPSLTNQAYQFVFTHAGTFDVTVGVMNSVDNRVNSTLAVDNFRFDGVVPVPVPAALWASLPLLGLCGVIHRRRTPRPA